MPVPICDPYDRNRSRDSHLLRQPHGLCDVSFLFHFLQHDHPSRPSVKFPSRCRGPSWCDASVYRQWRKYQVLLQGWLKRYTAWNRWPTLQLYKHSHQFHQLLYQNLFCHNPMQYRLYLKPDPAVGKQEEQSGQCLR